MGTLLQAQEREVILLPVVFNEGETLMGARGSVWSGALWVHNTSDVSYEPQPGGCSPYLPKCGINAGDLGIVGGVQSNHIDGGALLYIRSEDSPKIFFSNRIYEQSAGAQPLGVEIPVLREKDFLAGASEFLGIPTGVEDRISVRVYDPFRNPDGAVRLEVIDSEGFTIGETTLRPGLVVTNTTAAVPGYDALHNLAAIFPQMADEEIVHLRMTPLTEGMSYWGFITVTENESQHVTLITPQ